MYIGWQHWGKEKNKQRKAQEEDQRWLLHQSGFTKNTQVGDKMTRRRQREGEKVELTPRSSGRPSGPISWQWGRSHRCAHWARSAGSTARATFQGDSSGPQGSSCSFGQQGGARSLPGSRRIVCDSPPNPTRCCHVQGIIFPPKPTPLNEVYTPLGHYSLSHLV